ncbi:uncharacterized protein LOC112565033 isoform X1 [Pomacea canaliculata]|uniref:uncharacterized protein LOC112565033 isoform X1 n=1 Tax=Pomacea canaliculata TaxID=400727 RepID=UPI000D73B094|nr:uncharacterized protein LOC112565033 isoform X1 [Pomacea canaliculata]
MSKICDKLFNLSNICTISATLATVNTDIKVWLSTDSSLLLSTVQLSHVGVSSTVCAMKSFALGLLVLYLTGSLALFAIPPYKKRESSCDESQAMLCVLPLLEYSNPFSGSKLEELSDAKTLEQQCSLLDSAKDCMSNFISDCYPSEAVDITVQTLESVVGYVCSAEGKDALLSESECFANADIESSMQRCTDPLDLELQQAVVQLQANPQADTEIICRPIDNFATCATQRVRAECSQKAVNFVRNLISRVTTPIKSTIGCNSQARLVRDLVKLIARRK